VVAMGIVSILVGGFLPWLRSGRAWRNSYELVRTADRLGLVGSGYQRLLAVSWYLVPLLCGLTLAAIALDRHWLSHVGATSVVGLVAVMVVVTLRSSYPSGAGPKVASAGALFALAGSVLAAADRRTRRERVARKRFPSPVTRTGGRWRRNAR
jgi:hypothetical protein